MFCSGSLYDDSARLSRLSFGSSQPMRLIKSVCQIVFEARGIAGQQPIHVQIVGVAQLMQRVDAGKISPAFELVVRVRRKPNAPCKLYLFQPHHLAHQFEALADRYRRAAAIRFIGVCHA